MSIINEQESSIQEAIDRAAKLSIWNQAAKNIELMQGQVARYEKDGQMIYVTEAELVVRIEFGTPTDAAVDSINDVELEDFNQRYPHSMNTAVVVHRGPWKAKPYQNMDEQYWVLSMAVGYTEA